MQNSLQWPRGLVVLAALCLAGALFLPIWQIQLAAPQYPEGLILKIFAKGLAGDVDIINGLNHYIGMHTLHNEDFIEFTLLPYIIGALVLFGLIAAAINNKKIYYIYIALFMFVAVFSMVDFYRWEYNYGHNLDPNAAIVVPGMAYQPPLIGYKQLLNFGAYSIPDIGGWLFIGAGVLLAVTFFLLFQPAWLHFKKSKVAVAVGLLFMLQSCSSGPQPIQYGSNACDYCKMMIVQKQFACEWVTGKGKVYRFDDLHCLLKFKGEKKLEGLAYVNDFNGIKQLVATSDLVFVQSADVKAPMGGTFAAFANKPEAETFVKTHDGALLSWQQVTENSFP